MEKTDEQCEKECDEIYDMFPDANFIIAIDIQKLDDILSTEKEIIVICEYSCYCYDNVSKKTDFFLIKGKHLTIKFVINELIAQGLNIKCNHPFLEDICHAGENYYILEFGS